MKADRVQTEPVLECECGNPKDGDAKACTRCTALDGRTRGDTEIIGLLREVSRMTVYELAAQTRRPVRSVLHSLRGLERAHRVLKREGNGGIQNQANTYELVVPR